MFKRWTIFMTVIILAAGWADTFGQDYDNEISTMFIRGTVDFPEGKTTANIGEIGFKPSEIKDVIIQYSGETMTVAFPDYKREDSILVSPRDPSLKVKLMELDLVYGIYLSDSTQRDSLNLRLEQFDEVLFSQNNGTAEPDVNDPDYYRQWGLYQPSNYDIDAPEAWELETGSSDMSICIFDNGVKTNHEDLSPKVSGDGYIPEYGSHGTHVAGIAAAVTNNSMGIAGTNWNAYIYSRNYERLHGHDYEYVRAIIDILTHPSIRVINNSWRWPEGDNVLIHKAFACVYGLGVAPVASRGNDGDTRPNYPATFGDWMISVGAMTHNGERAFYSNYGLEVDFVAPGGSDDGTNEHDIYSTVGYDPHYDYKNGTSMAAPFVTGIIALIDDYLPMSLVANEYEELLQISALDIDDAGYDDRTGWGLVKARAALDSIRLNSYQRGILSQGTPYEYQSFPEETMTCYGWFGLPADGDYRVVRKEIRSDVNYEDDGLPRFCSVHVWGSPLSTAGLLYEGANNYHIPFCEVVPGSETLDGCILRTYVYDVRSMDYSVNYGELPPDVQYGRRLCYSVLFKVGATPPQNLEMTASPNQHPLVSWLPSSSENITSYYIYRKIEDIDVDFVRIAEVPVAAQEYEDLEYGLCPPSLSRLSNGGDIPLPLFVRKNAHYTVTAYDGCRESVMPFAVTTEICFLLPCEYVVGDVNGSDNFDGNDVTYSTAYFQGGPPPPYECECTPGNTWHVAGDVNASCVFNGMDVVYMVNYLKGGPALIPCPDCPPGGFQLLSDGNILGSPETITSEMNSTVLVEVSRRDSSHTEIIADIYLVSDDSVAFINIPLQWQSENIVGIDFQPSRAISGWEGVYTAFENNQLLFLAWNDLGRDQNGNEDPIFSNGRQIYLGQFTFSVSDTSDFRDFSLNQFDDQRIGSMMLGHPNGVTFSLPNFRFRFRDHIFGFKETDEQLPLDYSLMQNYPNPFNAQTIIEYNLPQATDVSVEIFDITGRRIDIMSVGQQSAGSHSIAWDASRQPAGIYFYKIQAGDFSEIKKCILLK